VPARALPPAVDKSVRALAPEVVASLRAAFAEELADRLPRLRRAAQDAGQSSSPPDAAVRAAAVRDAHTLGSSAFVVGEPDAARLARRAEALLLDGSDPAELVAALGALDDALNSWRP